MGRTAIYARVPTSKDAAYQRDMTYEELENHTKRHKGPIVLTVLNPFKGKLYESYVRVYQPAVMEYIKHLQSLGTSFSCYCEPNSYELVVTFIYRGSLTLGGTPDLSHNIHQPETVEKKPQYKTRAPVLLTDSNSDSNTNTTNDMNGTEAEPDYNSFPTLREAKYAAVCFKWPDLFINVHYLADIDLDEDDNILMDMITLNQLHTLQAIEEEWYRTHNEDT